MVALTAPACDDQPASYSGPHTTTCSTGLAWGTEREYPPAAAGPAEYRDVPDCVPRCGAERLVPFMGAKIHGVEALPSGACPSDDERCGMVAGTTSTCGGEKIACDSSTFECLCNDGAWRCYVGARGTGTCGPCADASTGG